MVKGDVGGGGGVCVVTGGVHGKEGGCMGVRCRRRRLQRTVRILLECILVYFCSYYYQRRNKTYLLQIFVLFGWHIWYVGPNLLLQIA